MRLLLPALGVALAVGGCSKGGYVPKPAAKIAPPKVQKGKEGSLFPFDKGNQWTYSFQATVVVNKQVRKGEPGELIYRVVEAGPSANGWRAVLEVVQDKKVRNRQEWLTTDKGIYQVAVGPNEGTYSPPLPAVLFPVQVNKKFTWKGVGVQPDGKMGPGSVKARILGPQEVDTLVGRRSAIAVESETTFGSGKTRGKAESTAWFQPGVGIVRYNQKVIIGNVGTIVQLSLKKHSTKARKKS